MKKLNKLVKIQNFLSVIWMILFIGVITDNASQELYSPMVGMSQSHFNALPDSLSSITPLGQSQFMTPETYFTCSNVCWQSRPDPFLLLTSRLCVTGFPNNNFSPVDPDTLLNFGTLEKPGSKIAPTYNTCNVSCISTFNTCSDGWLFGGGIGGINTGNLWSTAFFPNTLNNASLPNDMWRGGSYFNIWDPMGLGGGDLVTSLTCYWCVKSEKTNVYKNPGPMTVKTCSCTGSTCGPIGSAIGCILPGEIFSPGSSTSAPPPAY